MESDIKVIASEYMDWIHQTQNKEQWPDLVSKVLNLRSIQTVGNFVYN
jgi:hypothetical protein